jgi:hypothetical protein
MESFGAARQRGIQITGGAAPPLVQERKAENEECS